MIKDEQCSEHGSGTPSKCPETKRKLRGECGPDSSVSWCVAFAAFLINFIMAGLSRMSGILFVAFIEMFGTDRKGASMPFSVRSSTMNLLGPVVGILGQKYGVRNVSILGGILGTLSSAACFFVNDITWITVIWGGMNGVGTALVTTLTTVVIAQYFDKHTTTASGLAFSGACIGSFVFPPLMEILLDVYGLEGSFLVIAAIIMHTIPASMILRKPSWIKAAKNKSNDVESAKTQTEVERNSLPNKVEERMDGVDLPYLRTNPDLVLKLLTADLSTEEKDKKCELCPPKEEILREMEDVYSFIGRGPISLRLSEVPPKLRLKFECETSPVSGKNRSLRVKEVSSGSDHSEAERSHSFPGSPKAHPKCKPFILSKLHELHNKSEKQISSSFSETKFERVLKELRKLHKVYEAVKRRNIFTNEKSCLRISKSKPRTLVQNPAKVPSSGIWINIKKSVELHANPLFLLISICKTVHFSTFIPIVTIIVDYAMDKGMEEDDGKYVIAILSVGDLMGRLCLGWITDRGFVSLPKYMLAAMISQGIVTAWLPSMNTMATLLPTITLYAMLQGSVFVRHSVLISKYMRSDEQSIAMGCVNFFAGLFGFAVPAYVGFFRDTMGSYDGIFYCNGAIGALTGFIWAFEPIFVKMSSNFQQEVSEPSGLKV